MARPAVFGGLEGGEGQFLLLIPQRDISRRSRGAVLFLVDRGCGDGCGWERVLRAEFQALLFDYQAFFCTPSSWTVTIWTEGVGSEGGENTTQHLPLIVI